MYVCTCAKYVCVCMYLCVPIYVCMYVCMYVQTCVYLIYKTPVFLVTYLLLYPDIKEAVRYIYNEI
jgi:hypothetical protein